MSTANNKVKSPAELLDARKALEAAEKAEFRQAVMSLFIPLALFIACCIFAAGVFMIYYDEPAGWGFIATTVVLALAAFVALFKFQNKFRARGIIPTKDTTIESNVVDARPEALPEKDLRHADTTSDAAIEFESAYSDPAPSSSSATNSTAAAAKATVR